MRFFDQKLYKVFHSSTQSQRAFYQLMTVSYSKHEMELTRTIFFLCYTYQIFGLLSDKEIIEYVQLLSETKIDYVRVDNLDKAVIKGLITYYRIEFQKSNKSQELNTITFCTSFCDNGIDHLNEYLLQKNILIINLTPQNEEK